VGVACLCAGSAASAIEVERRSVTPVTTFTVPGTAPPCAQTSFPLPNGGFEQGGLESWSAADGKGSQIEVVSPGKDSQYAAKLSMDDKPGHYPPSLVHDTVYGCPWAVYTLDFDYMMPETAEGCVLHVGMGFTVPPAAFQLPIVETPWKHKQLNFSTSEERYATLEARLRCPDGVGATAFVDNFSVKPQPPPATLENPGCPRQMFIENGAFEYGSLEYWRVRETFTHNVTYSVVSPGHGADSAYMFQADFHGPSTYNRIYLARNVFNFCVGYNYTFAWSYRFKGYDYGNHPHYCELEFVIPDCDAFNEPLLDPHESWTRANITCNSRTSGEKEIEFNIYCAQSGTGPPYNFTEFSFQFDNLGADLAPPQTLYPIPP